ncbi:MAG: hypothetical protein HOO06_14260 [Bdellovibrionaceae bacterium]|jgi:hypothetical protein|nr:hypothetical protein [Pseudobdellovibrionaceae bacterium]
MKSFYSQYKDLAKKTYPEEWSSLQGIPFEKLLSPYNIKLPKIVYDRAQSSIQNIFKLAHTKTYNEQFAEDRPSFLDVDTDNYSVLMAYDYHITSDYQPKLIEVNTNASGYILSDLLYELKGGAPCIDKIKESIISELKLFYKVPPISPLIVIIDEEIEQQKMNFEFYVYKDLFEKWGFRCEVLDYKDLKYDESGNQLMTPSGQQVHLVYNRYCDFLFLDASSQQLNQAYLNKAAAFSPQPKEYFLLADKNRLIDFSQSDYFNAFSHLDININAIQSSMIPTYHQNSFKDSEELWAKRKKLFFKPKRSHGGKGTYRGKSISKKVFQQVIENDFLAQEFVPAPVFMDPDGQDWKYDLRFYTYKDEIQLAVARLYQGQVTNFSTDFGGFTTVEFI